MEQEIKASEFKAKCLKLMDEVAATGKTLVITKNGKPVARLEPMPRKIEQIFGALKGWITIPDDEAYAAAKREMAEEMEREWEKKWDRRFAEDRKWHAKRTAKPKSSRKAPKASKAARPKPLSRPEASI